MRLEDPRRETVAWSRARGESLSVAGHNAGVNRSTVTRWIKDPDLSARVDELKIMLERAPADEGEEARRGLARLVPMAEAVVEAGLKGEMINGKPVTSQMHSNALKTIELARKLEPRDATTTGAPALGDLIAQADAARSAGN